MGKRTVLRIAQKVKQEFPNSEPLQKYCEALVSRVKTMTKSQLLGEAITLELILYDDDFRNDFVERLV